VLADLWSRSCLADAVTVVSLSSDDGQRQIAVPVPPEGSIGGSGQRAIGSEPPPDEV